MPRGRSKNDDSMLLKSADLLGWAIGGIEREILQTRERLAALTAQAARLRQRAQKGGRAVGAAAGAQDTTAPEAGGTSKGARKGRGKRKRKMSPEGRKRISDMMKKRWAERRKKGGE